MEGKGAKREKRERKRTALMINKGRVSSIISRDKGKVWTECRSDAGGHEAGAITATEKQ